VTSERRDGQHLTVDDSTRGHDNSSTSFMHNKEGQVERWQFIVPIIFLGWFNTYRSLSFDTQKELSNNIQLLSNK